MKLRTLHRVPAILLGTREPKPRRGNSSASASPAPVLQNISLRTLASPFRQYPYKRHGFVNMFTKPTKFEISETR